DPSRELPMPNVFRSTLIGATLLAAVPACAQSLTADEFRRELVGLPLCGTPTVGPLAGKALCTVHLPDGTAILSGSGILVRGIWAVEGGKICRRNDRDVPDRRRSADGEREIADRGLFTRERVVRIPRVPQRFEPQRARVDHEQAADQALPEADDLSDHFERHQRAEDPGERAENSGLGASRYR